MDKISITEAQSLLNAADEAMIDFEHKRERKAIFGERLTTTIKLPPEGEFRECYDEERRELRRSIGDASEKEIYRRLQAYEDTGLTPDEVVNVEKLLQMRSEQVARLVDKIERLQKIIENAKYILGKEDEIDG